MVTTECEEDRYGRFKTNYSKWKTMLENQQQPQQQWQLIAKFCRWFFVEKWTNGNSNYKMIGNGTYKFIITPIKQHSNRYYARKLNGKKAWPFIACCSCWPFSQKSYRATEIECENVREREKKKVSSALKARCWGQSPEWKRRKKNIIINNVSSFTLI